MGETLKQPDQGDIGGSTTNYGELMQDARRDAAAANAQAEGVDALVRSANYAAEAQDLNMIKSGFEAEADSLIRTAAAENPQAVGIENLAQKSQNPAEAQDLMKLRQKILDEAAQQK